MLHSSWLVYKTLSRRGGDRQPSSSSQPFQISLHFISQHISLYLSRVHLVFEAFFQMEIRELVRVEESSVNSKQHGKRCVFTCHNLQCCFQLITYPTNNTATFLQVKNYTKHRCGGVVIIVELLSRITLT